MKCNKNLCLIFFKARLDSGNEEMIQKLKDQLKETHEELDQSKQELQSKEEQVQAVRQEVSSVWYHSFWSSQLRKIKIKYTCTSIAQINVIYFDIT